MQKKKSIQDTDRIQFYADILQVVFVGAMIAAILSNLTFLIIK